MRMRGSFLDDVLKLSIGTLTGRMITLAALPVLTRLYSPVDFALLAVFLALVNTLAVGACLRLEIAIPLVKSDEEAGVVLILALIVLGAIALMLLIPALILPDSLAGWLGAPGIAPYFWLVPVAVALAGSYSAFQYWSTRARRFGDISRTRIGQAVLGVTVMLVLGWVGVAPLGLLLGNILTAGAGGVSLAISALRHNSALLRPVPLSTLCAALRRQRNYPMLSVPEALLNLVGSQVPVLVIAANAGAEAGFLLLAMQAMAAPMALLGSSISQVYMSRAPQEYRSGTLAAFTRTIIRRLVLVGVGPLTLVGVLAPTVFPLVFGAQWARAGDIAFWLVPWMALQFVASPVSMVMYVVGWQKTMLLLQTLGSVIRVGLTSFGVSVWNTSIEAFAISSAAFYAICLGVFVAAASAKNNVDKEYGRIISTSDS